MVVSLTHANRAFPGPFGPGVATWVTVDTREADDLVQDTQAARATASR
jgi:hypothetical protein